MQKETHRKTVKTRAILPMARILFRITSLRAATDPPGKRKKVLRAGKNNTKLPLTGETQSRDLYSFF